MCFYLFFCFKQKTAYEMRISDWSSDVCSSDLHGLLERQHFLLAHVHAQHTRERAVTARVQAVEAAVGTDVRLRPGDELRDVPLVHAAADDQVGRASCSARVCQYVQLSGVAVSLKKQNNIMISMLTMSYF